MRVAWIGTHGVSLLLATATRPTYAAALPSAAAGGPRAVAIGDLTQ